MNAERNVTERAALAQALAAIVRSDEYLSTAEDCAAYASDVYTSGSALGVLRCRDIDRLSQAMALLHREGVAMVPRGGGMSYTAGYVPTRSRSVIIDTGVLDRIVEINPTDMLITVEAGVTWKTIYETLKPMGLRLPFFGTFSGAKATVGGGLSNGALFFGTARYGTAADNVLGIELLLADGTQLRTGQCAFANVEHSFYRTYGPDFVGLFTHDCGTLGVKVRATFRLIPTPEHADYVSFAFPDLGSAALALSAVARSGAAEDAYVLDPASTRKNLDAHGIKDDLRTLAQVVRNERSLLKGLKSGMQMALGGKDFLSADAFSLHAVAAGRSAAAVTADIEALREACQQHGGAEIPNSVPKASRAGMFPAPNGVLGVEGDRWAALNAKVAHSGAKALIDAANAMLRPYQERMRQHKVWMTYLYIAVGNHSFSFEPVFHWFDEWLPMHRNTPEPAYLRGLANPAANLPARELVAELRGKMTELFLQHGAASNQIGKTYRYRDALRPTTRQLLDQVKKALDPKGLMNPGALGFES